MGKYIRRSLDVVYEQENKRYFSRIASAKGLQRKLFNEETKYEVSTDDVEIEVTKKDGDVVCVDAILLTLCRENYDTETGNVIETSFLEIIVSEMLGMFATDWH